MDRKITVRRNDVLPRVEAGQRWVFGRISVRIISTTAEEVCVGWLAPGSETEVRAVHSLTFEEFQRRVTEWHGKLK